MQKWAVQEKKVMLNKAQKNTGTLVLHLLKKGIALILNMLHL